mgnify:CR=1 FL=1
MSKQHQSIRIFKNDYLEKLTHVHPLTPLIMWGPFAVWMIWRALMVHSLSVWMIASVGICGFLAWTLVEYGAHRFIFHITENGKLDGTFVERFQYVMHGLHHDDPVDATRLVLPPAPAAAFAIIFYSIFIQILGPVWVEPFFAFFLIGYLCYDYIHFAVHHFKPMTPVGRYLKQVHMIHHFVNPKSHWGVSSPLWDYVFGTLESPKSVEHGS